VAARSENLMLGKEKKSIAENEKKKRLLDKETVTGF
jgi:hypothetical protein